MPQSPRRQPRPTRGQETRPATSRTAARDLGTRATRRATRAKRTNGTSGAPMTICHRVRIPWRTRNAPECRPCAKRRAAIVERLVSSVNQAVAPERMTSARPARESAREPRLPRTLRRHRSARLEVLRDRTQRCRRRSRGQGRRTTQARPNTQIEGGATGGRRSGKDVESAANAGRTGGCRRSGCAPTRPRRGTGQW